MKETTDNKMPSGFARYSVWCALLGVLSYLFFFPNGIFYCFFFGVLALTSAILARRSGTRSSRTIVGIVVGVFDMILGLAAFYGMLLIYSSLSDPEMGPRVTRMIQELLEANGLSLSTFSQIMY